MDYHKDTGVVRQLTNAAIFIASYTYEKAFSSSFYQSYTYGFLNGKAYNYPMNSFSLVTIGNILVIFKINQ